MRKLFTRSAVKELVRHCGGIPRKINLLCDNALFGAYAQGARKVSLKHMNVAVRDYHNLLWTTRDRSLLSRIRNLSRIRHGQGLTFASLASVCGLVLLALVLCYRLNPVAAGALRLAVHKKLAALLVNHADEVDPDIRGLRHNRNDKATGSAGMSRASDASAAATAASGIQKSKPPASPIELVAQRVPSSARPEPPLAPQVELPQPPLPGVEAKPPVAAPADPVATAEHPRVVVKKGDSLSKIASHCFGSGRPDQVRSLIRANPQITNANRIYPGQIIYVRDSRHGNQL